MFLEKNSTIEIGDHEVEVQLTCEYEIAEPDVGMMSDKVTDLCVYAGTIDITKLVSEDNMRNFEVLMYEAYKEAKEHDEYMRKGGCDV